MGLAIVAERREAAVVRCGSERGLEGVERGHEFGHIGDDPVLFGVRRDRWWHLAKISNFHTLKRDTPGQPPSSSSRSSGSSGCSVSDRILRSLNTICGRNSVGFPFLSARVIFPVIWH